MIEDVIAARGHALSEARIPQAESPAWWIRQGDVLLFVRLSARADHNYLRVYAPVLKLDDNSAKINETALFRHLLEQNGAETMGAAFALEGGQIVLTAERTTQDLDRSEVEDLVTRVAEYANAHASDLVERFGGRRASPG